MKQQRPGGARYRLLVPLVLPLLLLATGCGSTPAPAGAGSQPPAAEASGPPAAGQAFGVCPKAATGNIPALSECVHADLVSYWEKVTGKPINRPVVIEPKFPPQPKSCYAPQSIYAYYCPDNRTIYLNTSMLTLWKQHFTTGQVRYSLAMTLAHEVGHAAQFAVDPALRTTDTSVPAVSVKIDLQADCLAGVWAHSQIAAGRMDKTVLLKVWRQELDLLDSPEHRTMHESPPARMTATERGLAAGTLRGCGLKAG